MARMNSASRLFIVLTLIALAGIDAGAQFRRGMLGESTEINLFPATPPTLLLPAGSFQVDVKNQSTGPSRLLSRLDEAITRQMAENDSRLRIAEGKPELQVVATLTEWTLNRRRGTRYVSETRQIGTKQVTGKDGKTKSEPVYEYGRNKPTVIDEGAASVRLEVRKGSQVLADETARITYLEDRLAEEGVQSPSEAEDAMLDRSASKAAGLVTPARESVRVMLARSDDVDKLNALARSRKWNEWRAALQETRPHKDPKKDAYRLHNIGVAHEALAYESTSDDETLKLLEDAASFVRKAADSKKDEKYFNEALQRISNRSLAYTRLRTMHASVAMRKTSAPPEPAPAAKPAATGTKPAAKSAAAAPAAAAVMTNADVIDLRKAGLDDDNLIAAIKDAHAVAFDLTPAGLKGLLGAKITNRVISAMREKK